MRRPVFLLIVCAVLALGAVVAIPRSSSGQDDADDRIAALETQVAELQARVTELEAAQSSGAVADPSVTHDLEGTARLFVMWTENDTPPTEEQACGPDSQALKDIGGADVVVRDARDTVIGNTTLTNATWEPRESFPLVGYCDFTFSLNGIAESPSYTVQVGDDFTFSYSIGEMIGLDWNVALKLGQ